MSDVKFNIKLVVDGKERLVSATTDVKHFAEAFEEAKTEANKARDSLLRATQSVESMRNAISGLQQVTGVLRDLTAAYAEQEVVETKLANNMRNMMGAREADIQSIKDLCAAQQELGVIGDEVQLAGAQEMTTYLEKKSSLETLIPVMNDMLAQQYGLNATQEEAANIAMMLGKVMEGQTGALSRYGYYFDEAQEKILKFGTEEQRAAVLAEIVEGAIGGMNAELAKTDAGKAKQLANSIGDLKEEVGKVLMPLSQMIEAFDGIGNILLILGQIVWGVQGISSAIKNMHLATRTQTVATKLLSAAQKEARLLTVAWSRAQIAWTFGAKAAAIQMVGLRVAVMALKTALIGGGLMLIIDGLCTLLGKLAGNSEDAADGIHEVDAAQQEIDQTLASTRATLSLHISELESLIAAKKTGKDVSKEEKKIIGELGDAYGETMGYFSSVEGWYKALIANSEAYCQQMVIEARTRRMANELAELYEERDNKKELARTASNVFGSGKEESELTVGINGYGGTLRYGVKKGSREYEQLFGLDKTENAIAEKEKQMNDMVQEGMSIKMPVMGSSVRPGNPGKTGRTGNTELSLIADPKSNNELQNNLRYYESAFNNAKTNEERAEYKKLYQAVNETLKAQNDLSKAKESLLGKELSELKTLGEYEDLLKELRDQRRDASKEDLEQIDERIKKTEEAKQHFEGSFKAKTKKEELEEQLEALQREFDGSVDVQAKLKLSEKISDVQRQIDELSNGQLTIAAAVEPSYVVKGSREDKRQSRQNAEQRVGRIKQDYELGIIGKEEALKEIGEIQAGLEGLGIDPIKVELDPSFTDTLREGWQSIQGIGSSIDSITRSLDGSQDAWQTITGLVNGFIGLYDGIMQIVQIVNLLTKANDAVAVSEITKSVAQKASAASGMLGMASAVEEIAKNELVTTANKEATASFMELAAAQYMAAHASIPFAGYGIATGFATAAAATVAAIGASMMALPFADGGVVYGPTLGLVGEYSGASHNPEVIAPLDKLRGLLGTPNGMGSGRVRFEIKGRKLVGVLANEMAVNG